MKQIIKTQINGAFYNIKKQYAKTKLDQIMLFDFCHKVRSLTKVSKLDQVLCFSLPLITCQDRCLLFLYNICYAKRNPQNKINPDRVAILEHNLKLIRSEKFVKTLSYEIEKANVKRFRFFDMGQIENYDQLLKIFSVCENLQDVKFAMFTNRDDIIFNLFQEVKNNKINQPKNLNIILSSHVVDQSIPKFQKDLFNKKLILTYSKITTVEKNATCQGSKSGFCDLCQDCYLTPKDQKTTQQAKEIVLFQHGKNIEKNTKKMIKDLKSLF